MIFYKRKMFWIIVGVPNLLAASYLGFFATPRYVSEAKIVVYQESGTSGSSGHLEKLVSGSTSIQGDYLLSSFIHSQNAFRIANPKWLGQQWSQGTGVFEYGGLLQFFQRNDLTLFHYYHRNVTIHINDRSTVLTLKTIGYNPAFPQLLSKKILSYGQQAITNLGDASYSKAVEYNEELVAKQKSVLEKNIDTLSSMYKKYGLIDVKQLYQSRLSLINRLTENKAELDEKDQASQALQPNNPANAVVRNEIASLNGKIGSLQSQIGEPNNPLSKQAGEFKAVQVKIKNSYQVLQEEEDALVKAKENLLAHRYVLSYVSEPSRPVVPSLPNKWWILWTFLITWGIYVIVK